MTDRYAEFCNRYGIKHLRYSRDYDYKFYNHNLYNKSDYAKSRDTEILELEMHRTAFEYLVQMDSEHTRIHQDKRDEMYMRTNYPAVKEAYEKYRMLLELCK
jgi:hypothetical protein